MRKGRYEEALTQFKTLLELFESAEVYYNLGYIKTAQGRYEEALIAFRRATQINSAFAKAYQKMGEVYAKMGRKDEAQSCLERAAEIYLEKQMDDSAESALLEALKINPIPLMSTTPWVLCTGVSPSIRKRLNTTAKPLT
jgi:tetratricopeptide (TPR) repeat protein